MGPPKNNGIPTRVSQTARLTICDGNCGEALKASANIDCLSVYIMSKRLLLIKFKDLPRLSSLTPKKNRK
jgi:hypothetical protein